MNLPEDFLSAVTYEDDELPTELLEVWEPVECLGHGEGRETLLLRSRSDGSLAVAKCSAPGDSEDGSALLQNLRHPALPRFLAVYDGKQRYCVLREYVSGETLQEAVGAVPFNVEKTLSVLFQLCDVLEYLHALKPPVIHRDIKPGNVILREDGTVTLIDFGIARTYRPEAEQDTCIMGTSSFAPPEQYGFMQTDQRSDIYSLGVLACWMLTSSTALESLADIEDEGLRSVILRCTAFDPANRYASAGEVSAALKHLQAHTKKHRRGGLVALCAAVLVAAVVVLLFFGNSKEEPIVLEIPLMEDNVHTPVETADDETLSEIEEPTAVEKPLMEDNVQAPVETADNEVPAESDNLITFQEPLMEEAVRMTVGKTNGEALTVEDLSTVKGVYIFGGTAYPDEESFYAASSEWETSVSDFSGSRGSIVTLEDAAQLPNLENLLVGAERISDLLPLAGLKYLEKVEFRHNDITDISGLEGMEQLYFVGLNDNPVMDLSVLATLPNMHCLDLCDAQNYDGAFLKDLGDFDFLDIANLTDSWQYLGTRSVAELKLGWSGINSLEWISGISGLKLLELPGTSVTSLEGIEQHTQLETLRLSNTDIEDFTPLLLLPLLREVTLSEDQAEKAAVLENSGITIIYE